MSGEAAELVRDRLIVALDHPEAGGNERLVRRLGERVGWYKVGLMAFLREGAELVAGLKARRARVFLDLKFHDIPNTVGAAVAAACGLGADLCTVHAAGGAAMLRAAAEASRGYGLERTRVLAVTLLTSVAAEDARERVAEAAREAQASGCDGVVCSPLEVADVRAVCGSEFLVVTPGIRFGQGWGDQARVASPSYALAAGATHLVVGRPLYEAVDPLSVLYEIERELSGTS